MAFDFGAFLSGLFNAGSSVYSTKVNKDIAEKNFELEKDLYNLQLDQYEYQKQLQQTMFNREDSAVQRRAMDLQAAGLSKTLAAGGGASAGPVVSTSTPSQAPQNKFKLDPLMLTHILSANAQIEQTKAQTQAINAQKNKTEAETKALGQTFTFNEVMNPAKLNNMIASTRNMDAKTQNAILDTRIKTQQIGLNELLAVAAQLENEHKLNSLSLQQQELLIKQVALETNRYNLDWYRSMDLPTGASLDKVIQYLIQARRLSAGLVQNLTETVSKTPEQLAEGVKSNPGHWNMLFDYTARNSGQQSMRYY